MRRRFLTFVIVAALGCGGTSTSDESLGPACAPGVAPVDEIGAILLFTDISDASPSLMQAPSKGNPGWGSSDKYAPGVALADLDGDGVLDLVQPRNDSSASLYSSPRIYRGLGDGTFEDRTPTSMAWSAATTAALVFDFDADDDLDLFLGVDGSPPHLLRNDGDFDFVDVTETSGLAGYSDRIFSAAAGDIDGDGDVDLYTGAWNASAEGHGPETAPNRLFLNDGSGSFSELEGQAQCMGRATLATLLIDLDDDGDLDIYVGNDYFDDCLYRNNGDGTFEDIAPEVGTDKSARSAMGASVGDVDGDGLVDLLITDGIVPDESVGNAVFLNRGDMTFDSKAKQLGLDLIDGSKGPNIMFGWGSGIVDFDLDGDNDVHVVTHVTVEELFWQKNQCRYDLVTTLTFEMPDADSRGSAYGDIDGDGDVDIVVARRGDGAFIDSPQSLQVLRNDTETDNHWLSVDVRPRWRAPGATVRLTAGGREQVIVLPAGSSFMSSGPMSATFGLGTSDVIERLEVSVVGLEPLVVTDVEADERIVVSVEP